MAKANLVLLDGTKVTIEGTVEEVAILIEKFKNNDGNNQTSSGKKRKKRSGAGKKTSSRNKSKIGTTGLILNLCESGFFKSRRTISDVQKKLEEQGHIYALTSLSTPLVRLVRKKELRRIKDKKGWIYVN